MCTRVKNSATDLFASISSVSNSRFALSCSTSSDAFAIFVRARQASEIDLIRITIFNNSCSFSKALVSDCQAFSELSTSLGSCTLSNSARGVPEVLTTISESSAESQPLIEAHIRKRCKKVGKLSRPLSSGTVDGMNIPMLLGGAAAVSIGAVGAAARPLRSMYSPSLRWNSSAERSSFPGWFRKSLVNSSILSCRSPGLESSGFLNAKRRKDSLKACRSLRLSSLGPWMRQCRFYMGYRFEDTATKSEASPAGRRAGSTRPAQEWPVGERYRIPPRRAKRLPPEGERDRRDRAQEWPVGERYRSGSGAEGERLLLKARNVSEK